MEDQIIRLQNQMTNCKKEMRKQKFKNALYESEITALRLEVTTKTEIIENQKAQIADLLDNSIHMEHLLK